MGRLRAAFLFCTISGAALPALAQNVEAGAKKAEPCLACHGPSGNSPDGKFPILAGQTARYIYLQLRDFKEGRRSEPTMEPFVKDLSREDLFHLVDADAGFVVVDQDLLGGDVDGDAADAIHGALPRANAGPPRRPCGSGGRDGRRS